MTTLVKKDRYVEILETTRNGKPVFYVSTFLQHGHFLTSETEWDSKEAADKEADNFLSGSSKIDHVNNL